VKSHGFSGSLRLGVDGFALLPGEPLAALLREKDEVMVTWEWDGDVMGNFQSRIFG
jgi:hypothetical protein